MSDTEEAEGTDFEALFMRHAQPLISPGRTQNRLTAERRAARTPKQREHLSEPRKMVNFRANEATRALIKRLAAHFDMDQTTLIHHALHELAKKAPRVEGARQ